MEIDKIPTLELLGFTELQSKMIVAGLRSAHLSGGDGGGPYSDFDDEAFPEAIEEMHDIKALENKNNDKV